jgi:hypothetical protein
MTVAISSASSLAQANCTPLNAARCAIGTSLLVILVAAALAPIAYYQLGGIGIAVVGAATGTILLSVIQSVAVERYFARIGQPAAMVLAPMFARMIIPLAFVVAIVAWDNPNVPTWSAMYIAPLYLVMLVAETVFALRRNRSTNDEVAKQK